MFENLTGDKPDSGASTGSETGKEKKFVRQKKRVWENSQKFKTPGKEVGDPFWKGGKKGQNGVKKARVKEKLPGALPGEEKHREDYPGKR